MPATLDVIAPVRRLTPDHGHYFFGYYDVPPTDPAGRRHLCHRVAFRDRYPTPGDVATLGTLDLSPGAEPGFEPFGETSAWNFQQSSMLQWWADSQDTCLYNVYENGRYGSCLHDIATGERRMLPRPVANVARDGSRALCINMSRVYDFRPGYGYEEIPDPNADVPLPDDDGIWVMDIPSGETRFILSYAKMASILEAAGEAVDGRKLVVNHITFNPSASRFLFLARTFPQGDRRWTTYLLTADTNGEDVRNHNVYGMASHYHWGDDDTMLFWLNVGEKQPELATVSDASGIKTVIDPDFFRFDGHCSYRPDGRWILYDSYGRTVGDDVMRSLYVYSLDKGEAVTLGHFRTERLSPEEGDLRCDLHPRWMPGGHAITFDSIHEGYRGIYEMDLTALVG